jgi:hypothetical protein
MPCQTGKCACRLSPQTGKSIISNPRFPVWRSFWLALSGSAGRSPFHRREGEIVFRGPVGPPIPSGKSRLGMAKLRAGVSPAPRSSVAHEINCRAVALQVRNINWVVKLLGQPLQHKGAFACATIACTMS